MSSLRFALVLVVLVVFGQSAQAGHGRRPAAAEGRNEIPVPSLSTQVQQANRAIISLQDALRLSQAQIKAFDACAVVALRDLTLATDPDGLVQAQRHYLLSVGRVLSPSQFTHYLTLHSSFTAALLRLDASEVASR
jgi:hypothetical protein